MPPLPDRYDQTYWQNITAWAELAGSDGCTWATEMYVSACHEHDFHCVYHRTWFGDPITSVQAAARFFQVLQWQSVLGRWSPAAWWRWMAVRFLGPQWD